MLTEHLHPSDQDLLQAADGEVSHRRAAQIRAHLAACWECRARMAEIERTITDFARAHRQTLDESLPPIDGASALLRAQLAEQTAQTTARWRVFPFSSNLRAAACLCVLLLAAAAGGKLLFQHSRRAGSTPVVERGAIPDPNLTPGATRTVAISEVCAMAHDEVVRDVPTPLRQAVFQEYGIANGHSGDYEVDLLISPGLGGAEDIRNLWPEPYTSPTWNARVKDALEEHLHQMVCAGKLDLPTAQREIATDWIAAYKKFFHTDRPLAVLSSAARPQQLSQPRHQGNT